MPYKTSKDVCSLSTYNNYNNNGKNSNLIPNQTVSNGQVVGNLCPKKNYRLVDANGKLSNVYNFQLYGVT